MLGAFTSPVTPLFYFILFFWAVELGHKVPPTLAGEEKHLHRQRRNLPMIKAWADEWEQNPQPLSHPLTCCMLHILMGIRNSRLRLKRVANSSVRLTFETHTAQDVDPPNLRRENFTSTKAIPRLWVDHVLKMDKNNEKSRIMWFTCHQFNDESDFEWTEICLIVGAWNRRSS